MLNENENNITKIGATDILEHNGLFFVPHAVERMAQRNLKPSEVELVIRYGQLIRRTGVEFYFLGKRNIPSNLRKLASRLIGTTVIFYNHKVRTAYRNRVAVRQIRRKPKENRRKHWELV